MLTGFEKSYSFSIRRFKGPYISASYPHTDMSLIIQAQRTEVDCEWSLILAMPDKYVFRAKMGGCFALVSKCEGPGVEAVRQSV